MAVTFLLAKATPNCLEYEVDQDGNAGTTADLLADVLKADAIAGPLKDLLDNPTLASKGNPIGGLTIADANRAMLGNASGDADKDLTNIPHCFVTLTRISGSAADVLRVTGGLPGGADAYQLLFTAGAAVSVWLAKIEFQHTLTR